MPIIKDKNKNSLRFCKRRIKRTLWKASFSYRDQSQQVQNIHALFMISNDPSGNLSLVMLILALDGEKSKETKQNTKI